MTASPFEASFHEIDAEDRVAKVAMPLAILEWVEAVAAAHHVDTPFVKRRRDGIRRATRRTGLAMRGSPRGADVWRNPASLRDRK